MKIELTPTERLARVVEIMAEGVLTLIAEAERHIFSFMRVSDFIRVSDIANLEVKLREATFCSAIKTQELSGKAVITSPDVSKSFFGDR